MDGWTDADDDDGDDNGVGVPRAHVAYQCTDRSSSVGCGRTAVDGFEGINEERIDSELHHVNAISKALGWRSVYRRL